MTMKVSLLLVLVLLVFSPACKRNNATENIPTGPVSLTIDLNLPSNTHLNSVGNFSYFTGGIKGVIVIHDFDDNWYAFERTCAFEPLNECSKIWMDTQSLQLKCGGYLSGKFQNCCDSKYIFNGFPVKGPARGRLAQYKLQINGNIVYVYN